MKNVLFNAIGLMSGTSLDGLDMAFCQFDYSPEGELVWTIVNAETKPYPQDLKHKLSVSKSLNGLDLHYLDVQLGKWMGQMTSDFIIENNISVDFIASHGHTVFHDPENQLTLQIGNPNFIHAITHAPIVSDFRTLDVAKGGQGAPLVPIGDKLLFKQYDFCINLGGIANVSFQNKENERVAYDICVCNILLNALANQRQLEYDDEGMIAKSGDIIHSLLEEWNDFSYLKKPYPKSLGIESLEEEILGKINSSKFSSEDMLATAVEHIATHISHALATAKDQGRVLLTGGGAFNSFLIERIQSRLPQKFELIVADDKLVNYKEALIFAFLGLLNVRNELNTLSSVTGAHSNSISGQKLGNI